MKIPESETGRISHSAEFFLFYIGYLFVARSLIIIELWICMQRPPAAWSNFVAAALVSPFPWSVQGEGPDRVTAGRTARAFLCCSVRRLETATVPV